MKDIIAKVLEPLSVEELPRNLFYSFDNALRFELGGEEFGTDRPMRRFTQAYHRSIAISQAFFKNSPEIFVMISTYGEEQPAKKRLKPLKLCGIKKREFNYLGKTPQEDEEHIEEFGSDHFRHWDIARLKDKQTV